MAKKGGKQPGAGRPKGSKNKQTIETKKALDKFKDRVRKRVDRLFNAQASLAEGLQYLFRAEVNDKGKVEHFQVTDPNEIKEALDVGLDKWEDGKAYFITAKDPDNKALDSLLDRAFGKPKETVELDDKRPISKLVLELVTPDGKRKRIENPDNSSVSDDDGGDDVGEDNSGGGGIKVE